MAHTQVLGRLFNFFTELNQKNTHKNQIFQNDLSFWEAFPTRPGKMTRGPVGNSTFAEASQVWICSVRRLL